MLKVWIQAQAVFVEHGEVLLGEALSGIRHDLKLVQLEMDFVSSPAVFSWGVPGENQRLLRVKRPSGGLQVFSKSKMIQSQWNQQPDSPIKMDPVSHDFSHSQQGPEIKSHSSLQFIMIRIFSQKNSF